MGLFFFVGFVVASGMSLVEHWIFYGSAIRESDEGIWTCMGSPEKYETCGAIKPR